MSKQSKLKDRGEQCRFVGYSPDHDGDVYMMYNPSTNRVLTTRDIIWMRRMLYVPKKVPGGVTASQLGPLFSLLIPSDVYDDISKPMEISKDDEADAEDDVTTQRITFAKNDDNESTNLSVDDPKNEFDDLMDTGVDIDFS